MSPLFVYATALLICGVAVILLSTIVTDDIKLYRERGDRATVRKFMLYQFVSYMCVISLAVVTVVAVHEMPDTKTVTSQ